MSKKRRSTILGEVTSIAASLGLRVQSAVKRDYGWHIEVSDSKGNEYGFGGSTLGGVKMTLQDIASGDWQRRFHDADETASR